MHHCTVHASHAITTKSVVNIIDHIYVSAWFNISTSWLSYSIACRRTSLRRYALLASTQLGKSHAHRPLQLLIHFLPLYPQAFITRGSCLADIFTSIKYIRGNVHMGGEGGGKEGNPRILQFWEVVMHMYDIIIFKSSIIIAFVITNTCNGGS